MSYHVLITGATKGIGFAIANHLLSQGCHVVFCARTTADVSSREEAWRAQYPDQTIHGYAVDVRDAKALNGLADDALRDLGHIDTLINNAGVFLQGSLLDEDSDQLYRQMETNTYSAYHLSRAVIPSMRERNSGHIVNMGSIAGMKAYPGGGSYCMSKYAMRGFSQVLRQECIPLGIRVTMIAPGATWSASWGDIDLPEDRLMPPHDIAQAVWLAMSLAPQSTLEEIILRPTQGDV